MKFRPIKKLSILLVVMISLLASCTTHDHRLVRLCQLDSLMEISPQTTYDSLKLMKLQVKNPFEVSVEMKYRLLLAKAQNKLYLQMPSDSVFEEIVSFYDKKGSSNEKMEAHYLYGCIYRDQNEAPQAIKCFQEAIEAADTLDSKCDYITLFSIYGQMADIYARQNLMSEAIGAIQQYSKYALKAKDTYNYIKGKELLVPYYYMKGDTVSAILQTQKCVDLYEKNGYHEAAINTLPTKIRILLDKCQYSQAYIYLKKFEEETGLFDKRHSITFDRIHCYELFGQYYLGVGKVDSAEYCFRKLGVANYEYEESRGLLAVYKVRKNVDSIVKYAMLSEQGMDKILKESVTNAVKQSAALYDYSRLEKESLSKELELRNDSIKFWCLCVCIFFCILIFVYWYRKKQKIKKKEYAALNDEYVKVFNDYSRLKEEVKSIKVNKEFVIEEKKHRIEELEDIVRKLRNKYANLDTKQKLVAWRDCDIVAKFKNLAKPKRIQKYPTEEDWKDLIMVMERCLPVLYHKIFLEVSLGKQEQQICVLLCAKISNKEMAILLNTSTQRVTNAKNTANEKLFGVKQASSLWANLMGIANV